MIVNMKFNLLYDLLMKYTIKNVSGVDLTLTCVISYYVTRGTLRKCRIHSMGDFISNLRFIVKFIDRLGIERLCYR